MPKNSAPEASLVMASGCNLACPVCDCRATPPGASEQERLLRRGGAVIELRGEASLQPSLLDAVAKAKQGGWAEVRVRTNGVAYAAKGRARELAAGGVAGASFFLASEREAVHDAIARVRGAHRAGLAGLAQIADAGLSVTLEVPLLAPSLQDLPALVSLAASRAPLSRLRIYSPPGLISVDGKVPRELLPPRFDAVRDKLTEALSRAAERNIDVAFTERDGVPLCAFAEQGEDGGLVASGRFVADRGGRPVPRTPTSQLAPSCEGCKGARGCPGTTRLYLDRHGDGGLTRLQRAKLQGAAWTSERKQAARLAAFTVLRPTVNCNQDCWFCSANETSKNVNDDAEQMMRRIARVARTGVTQVSFSGGEPTLSRHLVDYITVARRSGVTRVEIVTNGVLLDRREKVDALVEAGLTNAFVSLHGHTEAISQLETRKIGDHARTVAALHHLAKHEHVRVDVNHVISAHNYRFLPRFVEFMGEQFGDRIGISFAYVTPQYRALERASDLMPRYRDVMPYLRRALARADELGIEAIVGSRQGVPPCLLGEQIGHTDLLRTVSGALTEDAPQKTQGPACSRCRLRLVCTGLWKPYAALHGTGELMAIEGDPITPDEAARLALEGATLTAGPRAELPEAPLDEEPPRGRVHLPLAPEARGTRLRVGVVGTGPRALQALRALSNVAGIEVVAIASPHAPEKELPELPADRPRLRSVDELLEHRPQALVVASSTRDHAASARAAIARGLPCLVEKPLATTLAEAEALAAEGGRLLTVCQQLRAAGGVSELERHIAAKGRSRVASIEISQRLTQRSSSLLRAFSRTAFFETFVHLTDLASALAGCELDVASAEATGDGAPERVLVHMNAQTSAAKVTIDINQQAAAERLSVRVTHDDGAWACWTREPGRDEVEESDEHGERVRSAPRGGDLERLFEAFLASIEGGGEPVVSATDGVRAMRMARAVVQALEASGAPFDRAGAPKRVASASLRDRLS